jgi:hypothetical protein
MNTSHETISDRGERRTSPLQSAAEMQQEVHGPAVSSLSDQILIIQDQLTTPKLNEMIRTSSLNRFAMVQSDQTEFVRRSLELFSKDRMGLIVQHRANRTSLCMSKAVWKYLRGFNENLEGEALASDFVARAVLQREFTVVEFFE